MKNDRAGFTLLEVLVAIAILATTIFALIQQSSEIFHEASVIKDYRTVWLLASQKMSEIGMDKDLLKDDPNRVVQRDKGVFDSYPEFSYQYEIIREQIPIIDGNSALSPDQQLQQQQQDPNQKKWELFKVALTILPPSAKTEQDYITWVAYFPIMEQAMQ